jgi:SAM-dependent methyltransferase
MKTLRSIIGALARRDLSAAKEILRRRLRNRTRQKLWPAPEEVSGEFYQGITTVAEMRAFFENTDLAPGPSAEICGSVDGFCIVCRREVTFIVNTELVRLDNRNWRETMKCPGCGLINRWRGSVHVFQALVQPGPEDRIYLTEAVTPLFETIAARHPGSVGSEYIAGLPTGSETELPSGLVRIEDVTRLTFPDGRFEAVLSFDVLEHVPDYKQALREFYRVLAPGGQALISVPFTFLDQTVTRAELDPEGIIRHLMEPIYHGDPLSEEGVLCYYEFGLDFLEELRLAGFQDAYLLCYTSRKWGYYDYSVMFVGRKRSWGDRGQSQVPE